VHFLSLPDHTLATATEAGEGYGHGVKVLIAHNRYRSAVPSGENQVVEAELGALRSAGVEVVPYLRSSDEIAHMDVKDRVLVPLMPLHSQRALNDIDHMISVHQPDIVHLHNPYPLISLSIVKTAHSYGVPVVQTVHNHRHSCARGSYFRAGHPCFECRGKALPWPAVQHGCYRDSRLQSVAMAAALYGHRHDQRAVDKYIAVSQHIADSLMESGLVRLDQVVIRPNSVPDPGDAGPAGAGLLFVGRFSEEKGVPLLLDAWERSGKAFGTLTFIGDGPERARIEARAAVKGSGVACDGPMDQSGVRAAMKASSAVVVPSTASEAISLVVLEAFSHGRPVIACDVGGLSSTVDSSVGWLSRPDVVGLADTLRRAAAAAANPIGRTARLVYEAKYSPEVVLSQQLKIYATVIAESRKPPRNWLAPGLRSRQTP